MPYGAPRHRDKRLYQPSITSFFAQSEDGQLPHPDAAQPPQSNAELPAHVQSNLINVGMRVRKAVPAGYQNKSVDELPPPKPRDASIQLQSRPTELQPFCGLHKIGGLSSQSDDNEAFPFLSSQDSTTSTISNESMPAGHAGLNDFTARNHSNPQKRRFEEDDDDEEEFREAVVDRVHAHIPRRSLQLDFGEADFLQPRPDHGEEMDIG